MKQLDVFWAHDLVGHLLQNDHGELNFQYAASWLASDKALPISCSLPLQKDVFGRKACKAFFQGILPEETTRKLVAKILGVSANNDFSLLEKIGGECAGAITFLTEFEQKSRYHQQYRTLSLDNLADILRILPRRPLLAGEEGVRLSLAGVQDKIVISKIGDELALPLDSSPSTHIIKPGISQYQNAVLNEAFCLQLAVEAGIHAVKATVEHVHDLEYLLIERYDRKILNQEAQPPYVERLHQEDFCQALGIPSDKKYQNEGGPSLKQCFDLVRDYSSLPVIDLQRLLDAVLFNYLIGNCDAHGKNFSLILGAQIRVAPFYDLISTTYYEELSQKMAMKLGGEYNIQKITLHHFESLAKEIGMTATAVRKRVMELAAQVKGLLDKDYNHPVAERLSGLISRHCDRLLNNRKT